MARKFRRPDQGLLLVAAASAVVYLVVDVFEPRLYSVVDDRHYLLLHTLLELASILVSFAVFVVNWEASKRNRNARSLFVGTGFLTVAAVDTMHALSLDGMPDFLGPNGIGKATYYWLFARVWAAGILLIASRIRPESVGWPLRREFLLGFNLLACVDALAAVTWLQPSLPPVYVDGVGFTDVSVGAEYLVVVIDLLAAVAYFRTYRSTRDDSLVLMVTALIVAVFSELAFTLYNPYDVYNLVGHMYKVVACYLVFRALAVSSVHRPYIELQVAKDRLERTVSELDARNRELDALDEVAVTLSSSLRPDEVLESAIEKVMNVMEAEAGGIFLLDEGAEQLRLAASRGLSPKVIAELQRHSMRLPHGPLAAAGSAPATALQDGAMVRSLGSSIARLSPLRSCMCAPVASKGRLLGVIAMVCGESRGFSPRDADLLTAIGYQLGLATENASLYARTDERLHEKLDELQRAERRSRFLSEVGALLGSSMELKAVLDQLARKVTEVLGNWCAIYLPEERGDAFILASAHLQDEADSAAILPLFRLHTVRPGEGFVGAVMISGEPLLIPRVTREDLSAQVQVLARSVEDIKALRRVAPASYMAAPLRLRGRTLGVIEVGRSDAQPPFADLDLALLRDLASRTAVALENVQHFQEALAQRRRLETIISQMADGVVIADDAGEVMIANAAARRMLGDDVGAVIGGPAEVRGNKARKESPGGGPRAVRAHGARPSAGSGVSPSDSSLSPFPLGKGAGGLGLPPLVRALAGELLLGEELPVGERALSASASPVRDDLGLITGAVVVLRDVTAEREIERMKDEFVATVSHELRTPLTAVLGYTDILLRGLRGPLEPRQAEALGSVRNSANRLLALINDILDMSRVEAGKQDLSLAPVELPEAVEHALSAISVLAASKGIHLARSVPTDLPRVLADEEQLQRIFGNLLSNSIKFTPQGGTVTVSAEPIGERKASAGLFAGDEVVEFESVAVTVSDTGIGIAPDQQAGIWDKFRQVDSSSRRLFGGTGLGLAIAKGLVELHGGRVWVESDGVSGHGSTFGFTVPVARSMG